MITNIENWRTISGHINYVVSNFGRIMDTTNGQIQKLKKERNTGNKYIILSNEKLYIQDLINREFDDDAEESDDEEVEEVVEDNNELQAENEALKQENDQLKDEIEALKLKLKRRPKPKEEAVYKPDPSQPKTKTDFKAYTKELIHMFDD